MRPGLTFEEAIAIVLTIERVTVAAETERSRQTEEMLKRMSQSPCLTPSGITSSE